MEFLGLGIVDRDDQAASSFERNPHDDESTLLNSLHRPVTGPRLHGCHQMSPFVQYMPAHYLVLMGQLRNRPGWGCRIGGSSRVAFVTLADAEHPLHAPSVPQRTTRADRAVRRRRARRPADRRGVHLAHPRRGCRARGPRGPGRAAAGHRGAVPHRAAGLRAAHADVVVPAAAPVAEVDGGAVEPGGPGAGTRRARAARHRAGAVRPAVPRTPTPPQRAVASDPARQ